MIDFTLVFKEQTETNPKQFSMKLAVESGLTTTAARFTSSNLNITDATSTLDVVTNAGLTSDTWYTFEVFVSSVSDSNKLDVTAHVRRSGYELYIGLVDNETGCVIGINGGSSNSGGIANNTKTYLALNVEGTDLTPESDFTVDMSSLKTLLLKYKDYYTAYTKYNGMMRGGRSFLTLVAVDPVRFDGNPGAWMCWRGDTNYGWSLNSDFCCTFWDVYKMFTGEFYFPPQYFKTLDGKTIYTTLQVTPGVEEYILNNDTSIIDPSKIGCKPLVCNDYQTGTNLGQFIKPGTVASPILLKNGSVLETKSLTAPVSSTNFRWYPYVNVRNQVDPENIVDITSYTNLSMRVGSGWGDAWIGRNSQTYQNNMKLFDYENTYFAYGDKPATIGPYIICSSEAEDGGISNYIDENEAQGANFWNTFPSSPLTIGYLMSINWSDSGLADVVANLEEALGVTTLKGAQLVTQQLGFYGAVGTAQNPNWNRITAVGVNGSKDSGLTTAEGYILPYSGNFTVGSADNTRVLWGISSAIDPGGPVGPGGAIGGGSHGSHAGGGGSFNDTGDNIGYALGSSFGSTDTLVNWYIGELGSNDLSFNLARLAGWFKSPIDPDASLVQNIFYKYSDKLNNICSLKVVYSPEDASAGSYTGIAIHGQEVKGATELGLNPMQGKALTNQFKQTNIRMNFKLEEYFGSFLDYAPYTKIQIYLPFAGVHELNPSDVVGKDLTLQCTVNFLTGDIVYNIRINTGTVNSILYTFSGNCSIDLPITAQDFDGKVKTASNTILGIAGAAAMGMAKGGVGGGIAGAISEMSTAHAGALVAGAGALGAGAVIAQSGAPATQTIGSFGGSTGAMSPLQAYLIVNRPKMVQADDYGEIYGFPCMKSYKLANVSEYVLVSDWHPAIPGATKEEIDEIDNLLKTEGIIL